MAINNYLLTSMSSASTGINLDKLVNHINTRKIPASQGHSRQMLMTPVEKQALQF